MRKFITASVLTLISLPAFAVVPPAQVPTADVLALLGIGALAGGDSQAAQIIRKNPRCRPSLAASR